MELTLKQAKVIVDKMPACTVVWNCWSAEHMVDVASGETAESLAELLFEIEECDADQFLGAQDGPKLDAMISASQKRLAGLRERIRLAIVAGLSATD